MKKITGNRLKAAPNPPARRPKFFGLFIIFIVAVGLILRLPRFVPPDAKLAIIAAMAAVFAVMVVLYIIKKP